MLNRWTKKNFFGTTHYVENTDITYTNNNELTNDVEIEKFVPNRILVLSGTTLLVICSILVLIACI